jgi:hypothetical protein
MGKVLLPTLEGLLAQHRATEAFHRRTVGYNRARTTSLMVRLARVAVFTSGKTSRPRSGGMMMRGGPRSSSFMAASLSSAISRRRSWSTTRLKTLLRNA